MTSEIDKLFENDGMFDGIAEDKFIYAALVHDPRLRYNRMDENAARKKKQAAAKPFKRKVIYGD